MFRTVNSSGVNALNGYAGLSPVYDRSSQGPTDGYELSGAVDPTLSGGGGGASESVAGAFAASSTPSARAPGRSLTYLQLVDYAQNADVSLLSRAALCRSAMITTMAAWNEQSQAGGDPVDARRALESGAKAMDAYHRLGMYREMELTYIDMVEIMTSLSEKDATFGPELVRVEKNDDGSSEVSSNKGTPIVWTLARNFGEYVWRNGLRASGFTPVTGDSFRKALVKEADFWKKNNAFLRAKMIYEAAAELTENIVDAAEIYHKSFRATVGYFNQSNNERGLVDIGGVYAAALTTRLLALAGRADSLYFEIIDEQTSFVMGLAVTEGNAGLFLETAALLRDEVEGRDALRDPDYRALLWERRGDILTRLGDTHAANMSYVRAQEALCHSRSPRIDDNEMARIRAKVRPVTIEPLYYGGLSRWIAPANIHYYPIVIDKIAHYYRISRDVVEENLEQGSGDLFDSIKRDLAREGRDIRELFAAREAYMAEKAEISRIMKELKGTRT